MSVLKSSRRLRLILIPILVVMCSTGCTTFKSKKKKGEVTLSSKGIGEKDLPFITRPIVRKYSPGPKIEGNKYIRNCEIFEIKENAKWREK